MTRLGYLNAVYRELVIFTLISLISSVRVRFGIVIHYSNYFLST
jgi:hypothetical protein